MCGVFVVFYYFVRVAIYPNTISHKTPASLSSEILFAFLIIILCYNKKRLNYLCTVVLRVELFINKYHPVSSYVVVTNMLLFLQK